MFFPQAPEFQTKTQLTYSPFFFFKELHPFRQQIALWSEKWRGLRHESFVSSRCELIRNINSIRTLVVTARISVNYFTVNLGVSCVSRRRRINIRPFCSRTSQVGRPHLSTPATRRSATGASMATGASSASLSRLVLHDPAVQMTANTTKVKRKNFIWNLFIFSPSTHTF